MTAERLHKVLAHAGIASRRKCEDLIRAGRIKVNGAIVREMGVRVDLEKDVVELDEARVRAGRPLYLLLYKPRGYLCTTSDQFGRKTILDLLPEHRATRLFTVGRLDLDAEGLVIVTNDGDFAHDVLLPRRKLARTYWIKVQGSLTQEIVDRAREGVWLSDGRTPPMDVHLLRAGREISTAKATLVERHHHQLRRVWAKLGAPVLRLVLVRIGRVGTEGLKKGRARPLTPDEVADLRAGPEGRVGGARRARPPAPGGWGEPARKVSDRDAPPRRGRPGGRGGRDDRGAGRGRDDRRGRTGRDDRGAGRGRDDRRGRPGRDDRADRGGGSGRGERGQRPLRPSSSSGSRSRKRGR